MERFEASEVKMKIKLALILGFIGIGIHLLINLGPLLLGIIFNSNELKSMSNINLSFNLIRIAIYFLIGFALGLILSLFKKKQPVN